MLLLTPNSKGSFSLEEKPIFSEEEKKLGVSAELLGTGQYAKVYKATFNGVDVAVKIMYQRKPSVTWDRLRNVLGNEIKVMSKLPKHPNIIGYFPEIKVTDGFAIQYISGSTLKWMLAIHATKFPWHKRVDTGLQILNGLTALHANGISHLDLKPDNVMLSGEHHAIICDFGFSVTEATSLKDAMGTPIYMAPEMLQQGDATTACDIYSFAILLWEMLANDEHGADFNDAKIFFRAVLKGYRPNLSRQNFTSNDAAFKLFLLALWRHDPNARPTAADALAQYTQMVNDNPYNPPIEKPLEKAEKQITEQPAEPQIEAPPVVPVTFAMAFNRYEFFNKKYPVFLMMVLDKKPVLLEEFLQSVTDESILLSKFTSKTGFLVSPFLASLRSCQTKMSLLFIKHPNATSALFDLTDDAYPYGALYHTLCDGLKVPLLAMLSSPALLPSQFDSLFQWDNKQDVRFWVGQLLYPVEHSLTVFSDDVSTVESIHCVLTHPLFSVSHLQKILQVNSGAVDVDSTLYRSSSYKLYTAIKNAALREMDPFAKELWMQQDAKIIDWARQVLNYQQEKQIEIPVDDIHRTSLMGAMKVAENLLAIHNIIYPAPSNATSNCDMTLVN